MYIVEYFRVEVQRLIKNVGDHLVELFPLPCMSYPTPQKELAGLSV
jgi:hypothetical protein